jgi:hypothetical protein
MLGAGFPISERTDLERNLYVHLHRYEREINKDEETEKKVGNK